VLLRRLLLLLAIATTSEISRRVGRREGREPTGLLKWLRVASRWIARLARRLLIRWIARRWVASRRNVAGSLLCRRRESLLAVRRGIRVVSCRHLRSTIMHLSETRLGNNIRSDHRLSRESVLYGYLRWETRLCHGDALIARIHPSYSINEYCRFLFVDSLARATHALYYVRYWENGSIESKCLLLLKESTSCLCSPISLPNR
jgi:hypothetical protein